MPYLVILCVFLFAILIVLVWGLLEERNRNAELRDQNNSLNGMFALVARFERHVREHHYSLALDTMVIIVQGVKSNKAFWPGSEFTALSHGNYLASRTRDVLSEYLKTKPSLSVASEIMHTVVHLRKLGLHIGIAQIEVVLLQKIEEESALLSARL